MICMCHRRSPDLISIMRRSSEIIGYLAKVIYAADRRAVAKYGYSLSPNERDLQLHKDY